MAFFVHTSGDSVAVSAERNQQAARCQQTKCVCSLMIRRSPVCRHLIVSGEVISGIELIVSAYKISIFETLGLHLRYSALVELALLVLVFTTVLCYIYKRQTLMAAPVLQRRHRDQRNVIAAKLKTLAYPDLTTRLPESPDVCAGRLGFPQLGNHEYLQLNYQPRVNLQNGCIQGVEAMLRWNDSQLGYVTPPAAFNMAERYDLVPDLSEILLQQVLSDLRRWSAKPHGVSQVAFNLHPLMLKKNQYFSHLLEMVEDSGLPRNSVIFEISEDFSSKNDLDMVTLYLQSVLDRGYQLSLQCFGTAAVPLDHVLELPSQEFKFDLGFVGHITGNPAGETKIREFLEIASVTSRLAVVEGVDTRAQFELVRRCGCQVGQGYYFSPAIPAKTITELARRSAPFLGKISTTT